MLKINKYGFLGYSQDEDEIKGPKNETLAEHLEHCEAKEGNCPFEKGAAKAAAKEDVVAGGEGSGGSQKPEVKKPELDLGLVAKTLEAACLSAAKSVGGNFLDKDLFSVTPSMTWDPATETEKPTGGFQLTATVNGGEAECNSFLDKLSKALGISRKPKDCYPGDKQSRINTHVTGDEAKAAMGKIEDLKKKAAEAKAKAEAEAAAKAKKDEISKTLQMATFVVTNGAKTVNFHVEQGDFAPNKAKVDAALAAKGDVESILKGEKGELDEKDKAQAEALMKSIGEIQESYYQGKHNSVTQVPQMEQPKPQQPKDVPQNNDGAPQGGEPGAGQQPAGTNGGDGKPTVGDVKAIHKAILGAAKTINYHIQQGDNAPNKAKIGAFLEAAKKLHEFCPDGKSDHPMLQHLCGKAAEIAASAKGGWKKEIGMVDPFLAAHEKGLAKGGATFGGESDGKSPMDFLKEQILHKKGGSSSGNPKEAPDAYAYDADRWAHMKSDKGADYMKKMADGMDDKEASELITSLGYKIAKSSQDLIGQGFPEKYAKKVTDGKHNSVAGNAKMFSDSIKCAAATIKDLKDRFPNMKQVHLAALFPSKAKNPNTGAEWIKGDESNGDFSSICFHADYGNVGYGGEYSYGHPDSRLPFDIFRHEWMHGISTGAVAKEWKAFVADTYGKPCKGLFKLMNDKVSHYAASGDIYEAQAECFAKITSHDYVPGTLPRPIEDFFYGKVLGCEPAEGSHQHLMHDPNTYGKTKPASKTETKADQTPEMDEIANWFSAPAPVKSKEQEKAKELVFA